MGGFFGAVGKNDVLLDVFFGTDYHSHLGTRRGGLAAWNKEAGLQREIHNIENSPFRTKFENIFEEMSGTSAIGCISDYDPQPLLMRSRNGGYAICMVGIVNNKDELISNYLKETCGHFSTMTGGKVNTTELIAALINQKETLAEGISFAQDVIDGTASVLIMKDDGDLVAARDKLGRLPIIIGKNADGYAVSFESFAFEKVGYEVFRELGPGEIVELKADSCETLKPAGDKMRICSFLWSYYGYPNSTYENINVETMRYENGKRMAENEIKNGTLPENLDFICGVPDSGTPHAIGYSHKSGVNFARAFIKYTPTWPRSFMPTNQTQRAKVAKMKMIPVRELIEGKNLMFVDDSIVRGTQMRGTVEFLYENGAASVHMRSACPPIMYSCKYLNFSRQTTPMELFTRATINEIEGEEGFNHLEEYADATTERGRKMRERMAEKLRLSSLEFQSLSGLIESIGLPKEKLCTYCWDGKE